jgi:hypothetical protein
MVRPVTRASARAVVARNRWGTGWRLGLVVGCGLLLVRIAFALIVPMGSAPDEASHFIKAYASARLDLGETTDVALVPNQTDMDRLNQSLGAVYDLGDHAVNPTWACNSMARELPATCVDLNAETLPGNTATTPFGTFQPYLYTVMGLPSLVIHDPDTAMLAMRLMVVLWSSILVTLGLMIVARRFGTATLLAALIVLTPMVLYTQGTLGTTGIEVAAAFGAFVAALDVLWERGASLRSSRILLLVSIASLILCRPLSVVVAAVLAVIIGFTLGGREALQRVRALPRGYLAWLIGVTGGAAVANLGWSLSTPDIFLGKDVSLLSTLSSYTLDQMPQLWRMVIGLFEWLDTELPFMALVAAWAVICIVLVGVFPDRDRRSTMRLWFLIVSTIAFGFVVDYTVFARVGGDVQGRHLLPLFQLWPLVAALPNRGEPANAALATARARRLKWCGLVAGAVLAVSVLFLARREAVGTDGPLNFFGHAAWHPQVGWVLPFAILAIGLLFGYVAPAIYGVMSGPAGTSGSGGGLLDGFDRHLGTDDADPQQRQEQPAEDGLAAEHQAEHAGGDGADGLVGRQGPEVRIAPPQE